MSNQSVAHASIEKFKKGLADAKVAGIKCGCNCGGFIDFEKAINHLGNVFHPCKKCAFVHDHYGRAVIFKAYSLGYLREGRVEYEPCEPSELSNDATEKPAENLNPTALPCQDINCPGSVDIAKEFRHGFEIYSLCKKCGLIHAKNGGRQLFNYPVRGYFRNEKIVFQK